MDFFGFEGEKEYLPRYSYCNTLAKRRKLFLHFFNLLVGEMIFDKKDLCSCKALSIRKIFMQKVAQLTQPSAVGTKMSRFDVKLHHLMRRSCFNCIELPQKQDYKKASLLSSFFDNDSNSFLLNSDLLFKSFVHQNIINIKKDRVVCNEIDCIDMYLKDDPNIKVFPFWEKKEKLEDAHIQKAVDCIKNSEFKNIYLVYPKEKNFSKHIDIKVPELEGCSEYVIKVIPYSLKTILRS